jgi:hypothetical protein
MLTGDLDLLRSLKRRASARDASAVVAVAPVFAVAVPTAAMSTSVAPVGPLLTSPEAEAVARCASLAALVGIVGTVRVEGVLGVDVEMDVDVT